MTTTKGYITVESTNATKGGLGGVAGFSTSDTELLKATFPNSPFWRSDDQVTADSVEADFNGLVLRGAVIGGYLFPEGFSRDYNSSHLSVVLPENSLGGKVSLFVAKSANAPPKIRFGKIKWEKPGDPANPFTPNPSSIAGRESDTLVPNLNPADQQPPPKALTKPTGKESRPPFEGPGSALDPRKSSKEIAQHTLGSYLLGKSKVGGE